MKSIYSLAILQRILDHFSVGSIEYTTYFQNIGSNVWRHFIETNQGTFELYSFPPELLEYAKGKVNLIERGTLYSTMCHTFDRYHLLRQLTQKVKIGQKQLKTDLSSIDQAAITDVYRNHGSIIQIKLSNQATITSNDSWNLQFNYQTSKSDVLVSTMNSYQKIDKFLKLLTEKQVIFHSFILKEGWFEVLFSKNYSLHFRSSGRFAAVEISIPSKKHRIHIFDEKDIEYVKEL